MRFQILSCFLICLCCISSAVGVAQEGPRYQSNASAIDLDDNCFTFAEEINFTGGSVFAIDPIDVTSDFTLNLRFITSCFDEDGDGIVYVFQPIGPGVGSYQQTLGYRGLAPSLGIEIDLDPNLEDNDPTFDHLAIIQNGDLDHSTINTLAGPVRVLPNRDDIEDCQIHYMTLEWIARDDQLNIYVDCILRLSAVMTNSLLSGSNSLFWGITAGVEGGHEYSACPNHLEQLTFARQETICLGDTATLDPSRSDLLYEWWQKGTVLSTSRILKVSPDTASTYTVFSQDSCGRKYLEDFIVHVVPDSLPLDIGPTDTLLCPGETILLKGNVSGASYTWQNGSQDSSISVTSPGTYAVTATLRACINTDSMVVRSGHIPSIALGDDFIACQGDVRRLDSQLPNPGDYSYLWNTQSAEPFTFIDQTGYYTLEVYNRCGSGRDTVFVEFIDCFPIYVPNAFTPNNDGINDIFEIHSQLSQVMLNEWEIYDRWGNLVFSMYSRELSDSVFWDGKMDGITLPGGVYSYFISITLPNGTPSTSMGSLTLIR